MTQDIAEIRRDYKMQSLLESDVNADPFTQFGHWWNEAINSKIDEVNAMTLATCTNDGVPSARIVLLKGYTEEGFMFFTNYNSHKGHEIEQNPRVSLVFFWKELERQIRVAGAAEKISEAESSAYFLSRPDKSKIGAWASPQSETIAGRQWIEDSYLKYAEQFKDNEMTRPPHWGGYIVKPAKMEFWQGRRSRLHDRIQYTKQQEGWNIERLAP